MAIPNRLPFLGDFIFAKAVIGGAMLSKKDLDAR